MAGIDREEKGGRRREELNGAEAALSGGMVEVPIVVSWESSGEEGEKEKISFQTIVRLSVQEAVSHLRLKSGEAKNRVTLLRSFASSVAARFKGAIQERAERKLIRVSGKVDAGDFEEILETLAREGLVVEAEPPKYVKQRVKYWRLA